MRTKYRDEETWRKSLAIQRQHLAAVQSNPFERDKAREIARVQTRIERIRSAGLPEWRKMDEATPAIGYDLSRLRISNGRPKRTLAEATMTKPDDCGPLLKPGTLVRYDGGDDGRSEYGIVVHCWMNDEVQTYDCYVAFFGDELPTGNPKQIPYVLRYLSTSLTVLSPLDNATDDGS